MKFTLQEFEKKIRNKEITIAVVGLGYVGLPLAVEFARKGIDVLGIEIDKGRIEKIKKEESYITDISTQELKEVIRSGKFHAESDFIALKKAQVIIICVPTPLKKKYTPDISFIKSAVKEISKHMAKGALVILESTTFPGTTNEVILPLLETKGRIHGEDFYLSFSPERIDPGNAAFPVNKIPKVVGGINADATERSRLVYSIIIDKVIPVSSSRVAETVKLLENTFRIVNIGLIDEIAMMAHKMKVDIWEIVEAAKTKPFGFMPFYPGPGVGGHCIPKDPLYLFWKAKKFGFHSRFIKLASDIITHMPGYVVDRVKELLAERKTDLVKSRVLVMGVTYKKDIMDLRQSPPLDIIKILQDKKVNVSYYDPIIPYLKFSGINLKSVSLNAETLKKFDCVVIATDHSSVDYELLRKHSKLIFDTRNVYKNVKDSKVTKL